MGPYCAGAAVLVLVGDAAAIATGAGSGSGALTAGAGSGAAALLLVAATGAGVGAGGGTAGMAAGMGSAGCGRCTTFASGACGNCTEGCTPAAAVSGVSTKAEYSRTSRPLPQSTSIRKFSAPWSTGLRVVTRITGRPLPSLPRLNCKSAAIPLGGDRPMRRNVSGEASRACSAASSPGVVEMMGISATSG